MPRRLGRAGRIVACLGGLSAGLLAAEGIARWSWAPVPPRPQARNPIWRVSQDPRLGTEYVPGSREVVTYRSSPEDPGRQVVHVINAQGWRGRPYATPKPPGTLRIACVGDSHTFGSGVAEGEPWPEILEGEIGKGPQAPCEVLNFGVGGYGFEQEARLIEARVLACEPDLVVQQVFINDLEGDQVPGPAAERAFEILDPGSKSWVSWLRLRSRLVDVAATNLQVRRKTDQYLRECAALFEPDSAAWLRAQETLRGTRDLLRERGVRFAVVLFPLLVRRGERFVSHATLRSVASFCEEERIPVLDLEPRLLALDPGALRLHPLDYHATAAAHAAAGAEVGAFLRSAGLLHPLERR